MPSKAFALTRGAPKTLKLDWSSGWDVLHVFLNGTKVTTIPDKETLRKGKVVELPDGNSLFIRLNRPMGVYRLYLSYNGNPLPGTAQDPYHQIKAARWTMFLVGIVYILIAVNNFFSDIDVFTVVGGPSEFLIWGILLLSTGIYFGKNPSAALLAATALVTLDCSAELVMASLTKIPLSVSELIIRGLFLYLFIRGYLALGKTRSRGQ